MDELFESFELLGDELLDNLLDVQEIVLNYELMMENENMEIMNDLNVFFTEQEQEIVSLGNKSYNEFINDFQGNLGTINQISAQLLNQKLVLEQTLFSEWMELGLEYPRHEIDNIHVEVLRAIDIIEACIRFIKEERKRLLSERLLLESKKRLSTAKLLSERVAPGHLDLIDPLLLERIMENIK